MSAEQLPASTPDLLANSGWFATAALAAWGWITRASLGKNFRTFEEKFSEQADATKELTKSVMDMSSRLARIEGRIEQHDRER